MTFVAARLWHSAADSPGSTTHFLQMAPESTLVQTQLNGMQSTRGAGGEHGLKSLLERLSQALQVLVCGETGLPG